MRNAYHGKNANHRKAPRMWSAPTTSGANRYAPKPRKRLLRLLFAALKKRDALVLSDYDKGLHY